ncbi:MAG: cohesin domain-containing protein [Saprospiraceae bacterium]
MEKTQRTIAERVACFCKLSTILLIVLISSTHKAASQCTMVCHNINLSLDTIVGGKTTLVPEHVLSSLGACTSDNFKIALYDPYGTEIGNMIDCRWVGYTLIVKVIELATDNSCWAKVKIEDKAGPNLNCVKDTISCLLLNAYSIGADKFPLGNATDNCSIPSKVSISMVCTEFPCSDANFVSLCARTVIATDQWGLTSTCVDSLWVTKDSIQNVLTARDTVIDCTIADTIAKDANGNPLPQRVGVPTIKGNPVWPNNNLCKILSRYSDLVYPICGKSRKIRRQWTITDWCTKKDTTVMQWIKIIDTTDPTVIGQLEPITAYAGPHDCNTLVVLPKPRVTDCSGIQSINYSVIILKSGGLPVILSGTFTENSVKLYLPSGIDTVRYTIFDSCLNVTQAVQVVNVNDVTPPTPVCDANTTTTLDPAQCSARIYARDLDNGSTDNCCTELYFSIYTMDSLVIYQQLLVSKIKLKYGEAVYNNKRTFFDLLIDKYINCKHFLDYVDLKDCGDKQVVLRVYEACNVPLYDPHIHGDSEHSHYCKSAYGSEIIDIDYIVEKVLLGNVPAHPDDLDIIIKAKNYNDCMIRINVQDKQPPTCEVDPIKYGYCDGVPYENNEWTTSNNYNSVDLDCQGANGKYDPEYLEWSNKYDNGKKVNPYSLFDSAIFKDNCGEVKVTSTITGSVNNCGKGTLVKTWVGTDKCGQLTTTCSQKLIMLHRSDFVALFPKDIETDCLDKLPGINNPSGEFYPKIFDDDCEQIGISYQDTRYELAHDACFKIVRVWKLIDWCAYDPDQYKRYSDYIVDTTNENRATPDRTSPRNCSFRYLKDNGDGYITYTQFIKVINKVAPTITKVDSVVTCAANSATCLGHVRLKMSGSDDCTAASELKWSIQIDSFNDGTVNKVIEVTGSMATLDADFGVGKHKVTFLLSDLCSNVTTRESIVDVRLCKKPTPYLLNGLAADLMPIDANKDGIPESGMLVIWAKDFNLSSVAACGQEIVAYSFSSDTTKKSITFTCDSVGQRFVNVWVTDNYGNQDFANTYILIQDNNKACTGGVQPLKATINGIVKTDEKLDIEKVNVSLIGSNAATSVTQTDGVYAFPNMQIGGAYKVMPKKNINPMNGVSTLDLLLIQKHILGVQALTSPYRIIAADINKSNDISSVDLVELRKLILGVYENFPQNESWRFVSSDYKFKSSTNPFGETFPESYSISKFSQNVSADFVGIKIGDVNGSVTPNQLMGSEVRSPGKSMILHTEEQAFKANDIVEIPVSISSEEVIQGYQFTIGFDATKLQFITLNTSSTEMTMANFGTQRVNQGILTTSFATLHPLTNSDKALFILKFKALKAGQLSDVIHLNSKLTMAEAYNLNNEILSVQLDVNNKTSIHSYTLLQNLPNPFQHITKIGFILPQAGKASLTIFDLSGRALKSIEGQYVKGYNELSILKSELMASGVFYYQLQAEGFTATKKMIVLE